MEFYRLHTDARNHVLDSATQEHLLTVTFDDTVDAKKPLVLPPYCRLRSLTGDVTLAWNKLAVADHLHIAHGLAVVHDGKVLLPKGQLDRGTGDQRGVVHYDYYLQYGANTDLLVHDLKVQSLTAIGGRIQIQPSSQGSPGRLEIMNSGLISEVLAPLGEYNKSLDREIAPKGTKIIGPKPPKLSRNPIKRLIGDFRYNKPFFPNLESELSFGRYLAHTEPGLLIIDEIRPLKIKREGRIHVLSEERSITASKGFRTGR